MQITKTQIMPFGKIRAKREEDTLGMDKDDSLMKSEGWRSTESFFLLSF